MNTNDKSLVGVFHREQEAKRKQMFEGMEEAMKDAPISRNRTQSVLVNPRAPIGRQEFEMFKCELSSLVSKRNQRLGQLEDAYARLHEYIREIETRQDGLEMFLQDEESKKLVIEPVTPTVGKAPRSYTDLRALVSEVNIYLSDDRNGWLETSLLTALLEELCYREQALLTNAKL